MGTTTFLVLDVPSSGGDTLYLSTTAAYDALSPDFREFLHDMYASHSAFSHASARASRVVHSRAIETVHPIMRTHPVTATKSLYVNHLYTRKIVGLKEEESARLGLAPSHPLGTRSALRDFSVQEGVTRRHMLRITPQAERPYF
ncbi:hypothetical protein SBRCBS47491_001111 [Sporothrix bragantina]|uniref:TauD/TfdA-like domain-containing protein n=1 Tax=Sporothrix bragantina TaxID=671064 RepID=A0ABP0AW98_9PEZI